MRGFAVRIPARLCATVLGIHALTATAQTPPFAEPVIEAVRERVEALSAGGRLSVEGTPLSATQALATLYELHGFQPFWDDTRLAKLLDVVRASAADGLTPADYHLATLERLAGRVERTPLDTAQLDLLATDAYTELLYHLYFAKVDPVSIDSRWNFERREMDESDAVQFVLGALTAADIASAIDKVRPDHWMYLSLAEALADYRRIESARRLAEHR